MKKLLILVAMVWMMIPAMSQALPPYERSGFTTNLPGATIPAANSSISGLNVVTANQGVFQLLSLAGFNFASLTNLVSVSSTLKDWGQLATNVLGSLAYQPPSATLSNIVSTITVDDAGNFTATSVSDAEGDLRDQLDALLTAINDVVTDLSDQVLGAYTNAQPAGFEQLFLEGPPTRRYAQYAGGSVVLDLSASADLYIVMNADLLTIGYGSAPSSGAVVMSWSGFLTNATADVAYIDWGEATPYSQVALQSLGAGEFATISIESRDNVLRYSYIGPQDAIGTKAIGATGNQYGLATMPQYVSYTPTRYGGVESNSFDAVFALGTRPMVNSETNVYIGGVASVPTDGTVVEQDWRIPNTNEVEETSWTLTFNPSFITAGFDSPHNVTNRTYAYFRISSSTNGTYVDNLRPRVTGTTGGGESPPESTLPDGLIHLYTMDDASDALAEDEVGAVDLIPTSDQWTIGQEGLVGDSWTNLVTGVSSAGLTNSSTLKHTTGYRAYAFAVYPDSTEAIASIWAGAGTYEWFLGWQTGDAIRTWHSTDGTATATWDTFVGLYTRDAWHIVVYMVDKDSSTIWMSLDGGTLVSKAVSIFDGAAPFAYGARFDVSWRSSGGKFDELGVWDRLLTQPEIEELNLLWLGGDSLTTLLP